MIETTDDAKTREELLREISDLRQHKRNQLAFFTKLFHAIGNPLTPIEGFAEMLNRDIVKNPKHRKEFAGKILKHAKRLSRLMERVLDLCTLELSDEPLNYEKLKLLPLLKQVVQDYKPLAKRKKLSLSLRVSSDLQVFADRVHLEKIISCLLINAICYNRKVGSIRVEAHKVGNQAQVSIRNSSQGLTSEEISHIFDPFYRVRRPGIPSSEGPGLGLAIAKILVEAHGGRIRAESPNKKSTTLQFTLPLG